jgi:TRAP-type uncharacterized transport system substrate-binding protein
MMKRLIPFPLCCAAAALAVASSIALAAEPQNLAERTNRGVVELLTTADLASVQMAQELASVVDDGATRRILPVVGRGATDSIVDLKALRGIDMAVVQTDVLAQAKKQPGLQNLENAVTYVAKLHNEELHLLARSDIHAAGDLIGKKVAFPGGAKVTGPAVFGALGLAVQPVFEDLSASLKKLAAGDVAAIAFVAAKPSPLAQELRTNQGWHFVPIAFAAPLADAYVPAQLTAADYPGLVAADQPIDTVAVGMALVVANLQPKTERYRNVVNFVDAFFTQFPHLQEAPLHPKWSEVNLAAELPGWKRFPAAENWLKHNLVAEAPVMDTKELHDIFTKFLDQRSKLAGGRTLSMQEKDQLFDQFQRWQSSQIH